MLRLSFGFIIRLETPFRGLKRKIPATRLSSSSSFAAGRSLQERFSDSLSHILHDTGPNVTHAVVGVSGGCDSIALFHLLRGHIAHHGDVGLHVIHFDHQQRGDESTKDCRFVQDLSYLYGVPCSVFKWDQDHEPSRPFSQETAREWRRSRMKRLLRAIASPNTKGILLTAHHLDDSNESLVMKLLRGAHLTSLKGMESVSYDVDGTIWARPLLSMRKVELVQYLESNGLTWREDASNQSDKYLRNRVRNQLIPIMAEIVGDKDILQRRLDQMAQQSQEIGSYLDAQADAYIEKSQSYDTFVLPWDGPFEFIHLYALHRWVSRKQEEDESSFVYDHLQRVGAQLSNYPDNRRWRLNIGSGWDIERYGDSLSLIRTDSPSTVTSSTMTTPVDDVLVPWTLVTKDERDGRAALVIRVPWNEWNDKSSFVQSRVGGRTFMFTPSWRKEHRPIKAGEFLRGQKVPLEKRNNAPILLYDDKEGLRLVAVYVETKGKWFVDAKYDDDATTDGVRVALFVE